MSDRVKVALVSGANRGIGLEVARGLLERGYGVVLGCRHLASGEQALNDLLESSASRPLSWQSNPAVLQLDVTCERSINRCAAEVEEQFGQLDVLVNNAGVLLDSGTTALSADIASAREMFEVNTFGAWRLTAALAPLLRQSPAGRVVNVSSGLGQISTMSGRSPGYRLSKASLNALTKIFASELRRERVLVNAACPGWVRTELGGPRASRTPAEGADTPLWLATLPDGGPTGGFFRDRQEIPW